MNPVKRNLAITMGIAAAFAIGAVRADDATSLRTESRVDHNVAVTGESHVGSRISQEFTGFAGSSVNAGSLVTGLRRGTPVTLTASSATGPSSVTFTPPTRPMGNGNVEISLALAQQRLASLGVTQPTPEQIRTALVGGTITTGSGATARTVTLPGVLTQRSQGMGWGNIARSQGTNLGHVISAVKRGNQPGGTTAPVKHPGRIVTASNERVNERQEHRFRDEHRIRGHENGQTAAGMTASGKTAPSGIVNGSGAAVSTQMNIRGGGGHGHSHGHVR